MVVPYSQYLYLVSCGNHGEEHTPVLSLGRIDLTKSQVINIWHCQQDFSSCKYFKCLKEELSGCPLSFNSAFIYRAPHHNLLWCKVSNQMPKVTLCQSNQRFQKLARHHGLKISSSWLMWTQLTWTLLWRLAFKCLSFMHLFHSKVALTNDQPQNEIRDLTLPSHYCFVSKVLFANAFKICVDYQNIL